MKKSIAKRFLNQITGIFLPVINYLTAASIIKSILILLTTFGVLTAEDGIYRIFYAVADGFFYFLPFFLALTAAKQWKADPFTALLIPIAMLYPDITAILEKGGSFDLLNLTVQPAIYHSSVLPVLFAVAFLRLVEKPCDKFIPEIVRGFLKPIICVAVVLPVTFLFFGPLGTWIGDFLTQIFLSIYDWNPILAGAFMGFIIQPMVVIGAHWSIVPVCINNILIHGYDVILPMVGGAVYGQAGAALAVALLTKHNKEKRRMAFQTSVTAALGVTEPALFGINVPLVRPMLAACFGGAVGGIMVGFVGTHCMSFAFPSFLVCVVYIGPGFVMFLLSMVAGFIVGFLLTMLQAKPIRRRMNEEEQNRIIENH